MIFKAEQREKARNAEPLWLSKFILRLTTLVVCIVAIGTAAGTWVYTLRLIWLAIPLGLSMIWNLANIMVRMTRSKPMHPGANVGCDLVLVLAFIVTILFGMAESVDLLSYDSYYYGYRYGDPDCGNDDDCPSEAAAQALVHKIAVLGVTSNTFCMIAALLHFTLFVWACVDTHRLRRSTVDDRAAAMAVRMVSQMQYRGEWGPQCAGHAHYPPGTFYAYQGQMPPNFQPQPQPGQPQMQQAPQGGAYGYYGQAPQQGNAGYVNEKRDGHVDFYAPGGANDNAGGDTALQLLNGAQQGEFYAPAEGSARRPVPTQGNPQQQAEFYAPGTASQPLPGSQQGEYYGPQQGGEGHSNSSAAAPVVETSGNGKERAVEEVRPGTAK